MAARRNARRATFIALAALALLAALGPASAAPAKAPRVPKAPQVVDPLGDANYVNTGQGNYFGVNHGGVAGPVDASEAADIQRVWFETRGKYLHAYIQVESLEADETAIHYSVLANPTPQERYGNLTAYCSQFHVALTGGSINTNAKAEAWFTTNCRGYEAKARTWELPDGTGVIDIYVPRSTFFDKKLLAPVGLTAHIVSDATQPMSPDPFSAGWIDSTEPGETYRLP